MTPFSIGVHVSNHNSVHDALALATGADQAGVDAIWITEDLYFHGALPLAGAIAARTSQARIGFSVLTPYGLHAARLAMELATLSGLAPGRVIVGLGAGVRKRTDLMQANWANPVRQVRDYAEALQKLLSGHTLISGNEAAPADHLSLSLSTPPGALPTYAAAVGPKALRQAGEIFDGVLLSLMAAAPHMQKARDLVDIGAASSGRDAPPLIASIPVRIDEDEVRALDAAKDLVGSLMTSWAGIAPLRALFVGDGYLNDTRFDALVDSLHRGETTQRAIPSDIALAHCPAGTLANVAHQVAQLGKGIVNGISLDIGDNSAGAQEPSFFIDLIAQIRAQQST